MNVHIPLSWSRNVVSLRPLALLVGALVAVACGGNAPDTPSGGGGGGGLVGTGGTAQTGPATTGSGGAVATTVTTVTTGGQTGTGGSSMCAAGTMDCGGSCVSLATDPANCGMCGKACDTGATCVNSVCACMPGRTECGTACVDTSADASNCGACGKACSANQVCSNSSCVTSCSMGQTACSGNCVDLDTSVDHCGDCAKACGAAQTCAGGTCTCSTMGQSLCSGQCKDTTTDSANCGMCGKACSAGHSCKASACVCAAGQTDCSGVCKTTATDATNCGACGKVCGAGQTCTNGACAGGGSVGAVCNYASGLNVAWVNFANDVPNPNIATFNTIFKNTFNAGGRVVRWWFHTNGTVTPGYDASGKAKPVTQAQIDGVKAILNSAHSAGISLNISLWSFDMLQANAGAAHTNNQLLLENDTNRQAYIDNYLTPLVTALKGTPGLYSYEIFNEPEGMGPNGWATYRTTEASIQKTVNWFAAAIHTADPNVLVTNGAVTFDYCSNVGGKNNYYSDTALKNVGGKANGTLNFYEVHYYTSNGASNSPFTHSAASWGLDKKLVIGEFAAQATEGVAQNNLFTALYSGGYNGSWAWAYTADWPWPAMQAPMQNLYSAHPDVGTCP